jgi:hypothetical protein
MSTEIATLPVRRLSRSLATWHRPVVEEEPQRYGRRARQPEVVEVTGREIQEVEVTLSNGDHVIARYGQNRHGKDADQWIVVNKYRGEDLWGPTLTSLIHSMEKTLAEAEEKKERAKRLAAAAKDPVPALLTTNRGFERVGVRGISQRSGGGWRGTEMLILRADGTKDQVYLSSLIADVPPHVLDDLETLRGRMDALTAQIPPTTDKSDAVKATGREVDLYISYDLATHERVTVFNGKEYRSETERGLRFQIEADLIRDEFPFQEERLRGEEAEQSEFGYRLVPLEASYGGQVYRSEEEFRARHEAIARRDAAAAEYEALRAEVAFDISLVTGEPDPEPEADTEDEEAVHLPTLARNVNASDDWEDE